MPQVQANLNTVAARIARQYPKEEDGLGLKLTRPGLMGEFFGAPARGFLVGVMGLAGIVLLAACANLGSLFAARTADRTREIAIRMAIGSSRWRILRQVLIEAFVISILAGACACDLSWMALTGLARWDPPTQFSFEVPRIAAAIVDRDGVSDLGARRRSVRGDAAAADIQDRS